MKVTDMYDTNYPVKFEYTAVNVLHIILFRICAINRRITDLMSDKKKFVYRFIQNILK